MAKGTRFKFTKGQVSGWQLLDAKLRPVLDIGATIESSPEQEFLALSARLPAGAYVLRIRRGGDKFDQALWLSPRWITGLFVPQSKAGPLPERASIHMSELGVGWPGWENENHHVVRAAELVLTGLREGRMVVPHAELHRLLNAKFRNPMLGILGAHGLLLGRKLDKPLLRLVLHNLGRLVPGHPDVAALRHMSAPLLRTRARGPAVEFPPMLQASYAGLLACDAANGGVLPAGSLAEKIAPTLLRQGSWTAWRPLADEPPVPMRVSRLIGGATRSGAAPTAHQPALRRVERYLREVREFEQGTPRPVAAFKTSEVCLDTGLPSATVAPILAALELREQIPISLLTTRRTPRRST